jgi:hypothetical protein
VRLSEWWVAEGNSGKLIRDIDRRQKQLDRALETGKTLVVFVPDPDQFRVRPVTNNGTESGAKARIGAAISPRRRPVS